MTTLIAWAGVDSRSVASLYIASDSRITWGPSTKWNYSNKLFRSNLPEIFGYCGDVTIPSKALPPLIDLINTNFFEFEQSFEERLKKIHSYFSQVLSEYPQNQKRDFTVVYGSRTNEKMKASFHLGTIQLNSKEKTLSYTIHHIPEKSELILRLGSGSKAIYNHYSKWQKSESEGTSRSIFSSFCDALSSEEDSFSGGSPQLVGLYRIGSPKNFGIIWNNKRYISGLFYPDYKNFMKDLEWRNERFEICDPENMLKKESSQPQPRPRFSSY